MVKVEAVVIRERIETVIRNGGTRGFPVSPLLHPSLRSSERIGSPRAEPGSAPRPPHSFEQPKTANREARR
jgi:hypothetical protein